MMKSLMCRLAFKCHKQIRNIFRFISKMMTFLFRKKITTNMFLYYKSMFSNVAFFITKGMIRHIYKNISLRLILSTFPMSRFFSFLKFSFYGAMFTFLKFSFWGRMFTFKNYTHTFLRTILSITFFNIRNFSIKFFSTYQAIFNHTYLQKIKAAFSPLKRIQLDSQDLLTARFRHKKSVISLATIIISFLFTFVNSGYTDGLGGSRIGGDFPPLGFKTATSDIVRPRTVIVPLFDDNSDGSITLTNLTAGGPHSSLSGLDYASASHTGFEPTVTKGNLTEATSNVLTITGGTGAVIGSGTTIRAATSDTTTSGILTSTDWNTFNNKQPALTGSISGTSNQVNVSSNTNSVAQNISLSTPQDIGYTSSPVFAGLYSGTLGVTGQATMDTVVVTTTATADMVDVRNIEYSDGGALTISDSLNVIGTITGNLNGNASTVTTNANLTGVITSVGNATSIASQTGTGSKFVVDNTPTLITPILGAATGTSVNLTGTATADTVDSRILGYSSGQLTFYDTTTGAKTLAELAAGGGSGDLLADGSVPLTADWDAGNSLYDITAVEFKGALVGNATTATDTASKTGTGSTYATNTSPTLVTPALGTPSALVGTNISGTGASFTAGAVTNATLTTALIVDTGAVTLTGNVGASVLTLGAGASSISGANTGDNTVCTSGTATTAATLATARAIGGVNFDGSAAITPTTIVVADTADATSFVGLWESATGSLLPKTDLGITYAADTGTLASTIISTANNIKSVPHHLIVNVANPNVRFTADTQICIWPLTPAALTITKIEVTLDAAANEVLGDLKYADTFIAFANATVINDFDTTSGVRSDTSITSGAVAASKCIYLQYDSAPNAAILQMCIDITFDFD